MDGSAPQPAAKTVRVGAAADLAQTLPELAKAFEEASGTRVEVTYGASGMLAKQLASGAPYDVFLSANAAFVADAVASGACLGDTLVPYARGHLAMWAKDPALRPARLEDLRDARYKKIAIANPEHAPYGRAAKEALTSAGVWTEVEPRVVYGENVAQTLAFAETGNAEVAIVAGSLVAQDPAHAVDVPESRHAPLVQSMVVCKGGARGGDRAEARSFAAFVRSESGRAIFAKHGFAPADGAPSP